MRIYAADDECNYCLLLSELVLSDERPSESVMSYLVERLSIDITNQSLPVPSLKQNMNKYPIFLCNNIC